jgi:hypothetical protein
MIAALRFGDVAAGWGPLIDRTVLAVIMTQIAFLGLSDGDRQPDGDRLPRMPPVSTATR